MAAPYTAYLQSLVQLLGKIDPERANDLAQCRANTPEETYNTVFGSITFAELYERSRKYAAFILHTTYHMHPADIDDGLQTGYTQLWLHLRQEPNYLKDKHLAWIGKGIAYHALHSIRRDWAYQRHIETDERQSSSSRSTTHSRESRHIDMRTDIHQAIAAVANQIVMNEKGKQADYQLWALYGLTMLHVSASEISRLFHVREQSMQSAYTQVRKRLQAALSGYAPPVLSNRFGQRAYKRVHLMIGAEHNPTVRTLRPERRVKFVFTLTPESAAAVEQLALDFLQQAKSYEKLVALHAHISNLAISTTAKHFQIPTSTLRYYNQRIGKQLGTPQQRSRE